MDWLIKCYHLATPVRLIVRSGSNTVRYSQGGMYLRLSPTIDKDALKIVSVGRPIMCRYEVLILCRRICQYAGLSFNNSTQDRIPFIRKIIDARALSKQVTPALNNTQHELEVELARITAVFERKRALIQARISKLEKKKDSVAKRAARGTRQRDAGVAS
jgi:hypothetical protein